jgi:glycolate oxidase FAD binding subunit
MKKELDSLVKALASTVGSEFVTPNHSLTLHSLTPALVVKPADAEQVRECLKVCAELDAAVIPAGKMTWLEGGNPLRRGDVVLSLARMNRVIEYNPPDLTAVVEAGVTLQAFQAVVNSQGQWLPLDPPGSSDSTLGAIASTASSGALRFAFGTPRDYVIGLRLAHADGTQSRSGGKVAKNVAGYDLNKVYVGSYGTLAAITELNVKLRPAPERSATMLITATRPSTLVDLARRIFASAVQPASIFLLEALPEVANSAALLLRFIESEAAVTYQLNEVQSLLDGDFQAAVLSDEEAEKAWKKAVNIDELAANAVRVSVRLAAVTEVFQKLLAMSEESFATADLGAGIIRLAFQANEARAVELCKACRREAACAGGTLFIERAPMIVKDELNAWNETGSLAKLMQGIKQNFDPQGLLSPGRFVAGI